MPYSMIIGMTAVRFRAKISKEGNRLVIVIPKALHEMVSPIRGKELLIELKESDV